MSDPDPVSNDTSSKSQSPLKALLARLRRDGLEVRTSKQGGAHGRKRKHNGVKGWKARRDTPQRDRPALYNPSQS